MKKRICSILLIAALAMATLCGCSLFSSDAKQGTDGNSGNQAEASKEVKITDKFSFADPTDLDFDQRIVLYCGPETQMVSSGSQYGMTGMFTILYAKEDKVVYSYTFYICDSSEHTQAFTDMMKQSGSALEKSDKDDTVLCGTADADVMEATLTQYKEYGMISDATAQAYADFIVSSMGATIQK